MAVFKCKMCGASLDVQESSRIVDCSYCGSKQTLPKLCDERRLIMFDRANHFRRNNEFDKASGIFEQILNEDNTDAEAYWSLVLCKYGVEYVEDPATHNRIPTIHRAQYTSVFDDENYKSALMYADGHQREIYQDEANALNEIQKEILAISKNEEPFDVFICYKETDSNGRRTPDSVLANELYHELTQEGYKVFFARISLEDKLGSAYEPYIFAALNSAKVMVVIGTKPEYFNAVWVKNEWRRYLSLIKDGAKKFIIPAYKDMDAYDLPDEFSHLQAQDMSKLGFMQDLIRGINKLSRNDRKKQLEPPNVTGGDKINALIKRAFMFLEDNDFVNADAYSEKVLDIEPEYAQAYLCKMLADFKLNGYDALYKMEGDFSRNDNYRKFMRFASKQESDDLERINQEAINRQNERIRSQSIDSLKNTIRHSYDCAAIAAAVETLQEKFSDQTELIEQGRQTLLRQKIEILNKEIGAEEDNYNRTCSLIEVESKKINDLKIEYEHQKRCLLQSKLCVALYAMFFIAAVGGIVLLLYSIFMGSSKDCLHLGIGLICVSFVAMFVISCIAIKKTTLNRVLLIAFFISPPIGLIVGFAITCSLISFLKGKVFSTQKNILFQEDCFRKYKVNAKEIKQKICEYEGQIESLQQEGVNAEIFEIT